MTKVLKNIAIVLTILLTISISPTSARISESFVNKAVQLAQPIHEKYNIPISAIVAQCIYESDYGHSSLAKEAHNYFGLKGISGWNGPTMEKDSCDGTFPYRVFASDAEGFEGYAKFLKQYRYHDAFKYKDNGLKFVECVANDGYCPEETYISEIKIIMDRHNLYQYDHENSKRTLAQNIQNSPIMNLNSLGNLSIGEEKSIKTNIFSADAFIMKISKVENIPLKIEAPKIAQTDIPKINKNIINNTNKIARKFIPKKLYVNIPCKSKKFVVYSSKQTRTFEPALPASSLCMIDE